MSLVGGMHVLLRAQANNFGTFREFLHATRVPLVDRRLVDLLAETLRSAAFFCPAFACCRLLVPANRRELLLTYIRPACIDQPCSRYLLFLRGL